MVMGPLVPAVLTPLKFLRILLINERLLTMVEILLRDISVSCLSGMTLGSLKARNELLTKLLNEF